MSTLRFSRWSRLRQASAASGIAALLGIVACGGGNDPEASGTRTPEVVAAPSNRLTIVGQISSFFIEGQGPGLSFGWEELPGGTGEWRASTGTVTSDDVSSYLIVGPASIGMDKTRFRSRVSNTAGSVLSAEARMDVAWGTVDTLEPASITFGPGAEGLSSADGGSPGGGDGEGAGVGGGLGKTPRAIIGLNRVADGASLGSAPAGATSGIVRVRAGPGTVPVVITLTGSTDATYYDEGRDAMMPLPTGQQLHALVLSFDRHLGVTTLTEAAYRYALNHFLQDPAEVQAGSVPLKRSATLQELARLTPAQIRLANEAIRDGINLLLPPRYAIDSISTLPTPVDSGSPQASITDNIYGRMQAVVGGLALAAGRFEPSLANPALRMNEQLADDLTDGIVDGQALDRRTVFGPAGSNAYIPGSLPQMLADAADAQFQRFGDGTIQAPPVITTHPASASLPQGSTHTFAVAATGSNLRYQWQQSPMAGTWADLPDATQSSFRTAEAGTYRAIVSNPAGARASESAMLSFTTGSLPVITDISVACLAGMPCEWVVSATSPTPMTWQWYQVYNNGTSVPIPNETAPNFAPSFLGSVNVVVVRNSAGPTTGPWLTWRD